VARIDKQVGTTAGRFYPAGEPAARRSEKAGWGIPCNQGAAGRLWVGKGKVCGFGDQFSVEEEKAVRAALDKGRENRNGHFWLDRKKRVVTMQVGESYENRQHRERY
jgi:hypothetical protein